MTTPAKTLLECLAIELGTHMINSQIANLEIEELTRNKTESDILIDGLKNRIINLEIDIKALRSEVIAFREIVISEPTKKIKSK